MLIIDNNARSPENTQSNLDIDGITRNHIDHILGDTRHGINYLDITNLKRAVAQQLLVGAKFRLRLLSQKTATVDNSTMQQRQM